MISLHVYPTLKRNQIYYKSGSFLPMCTEIDIIVQLIYLLTNNKRAICASCPHACITPLFFEI